YHGLRPEHLYLFFAYINKKFFLARTRKQVNRFRHNLHIFILKSYVQCISYIINMSSELELLKQRITELEAKNDKLEAENVELRKENTEIRDLRIKLSVSDAEIAELKRRNAETLRSNAEYNERRDAENAKLKARIEEMESEFGDRITKVEQKQTL